MDKITSLPDNVIDLILEKLAVIDRVRTSALSRSWRLRWTRLRSLPLGFHFYNSVRELFTNRPTQYANTIHSVLLQQDGLIEECSLYIPELFLPWISSFQLSISLLSMCSSIKTLTLRAGDGHSDSSCGSSISPIFSMVNLRHLSISFFYFCPPPWFDGFPNLRRLYLSSESITVGTISHFISVCPQLEEANLSGVWFVDQDFEIKGPKLRRLTLCGNFKDIRVSCAPKLESVHLWVTTGQSSYDEARNPLDMFKYIDSVTTLVEEMSLNGGICELLGRCSRQLRFNRLERLVFKSMDIRDTCQLQCALRILTWSPNVKELTLAAKPFLDVDDPTTLELELMVEKYICDDFRHLRRVKYFLGGTKTDMKIIERLLRFSPALEVMIIVAVAYTMKDAKLQVLETVKNLYRVSTKVKFELV